MGCNKKQNRINAYSYRIDLFLRCKFVYVIIADEKEILLPAYYAHNTSVPLPLYAAAFFLTDNLLRVRHGPVGAGVDDFGAQVAAVVRPVHVHEQLRAGRLVQALAGCEGQTFIFWPGKEGKSCSKKTQNYVLEF